ncbi:MAG: hypothetical protein CMK92_06590 [Pseudomonas sp.]|nr:hypothetical protein [Pseudomonas sp.]
MELEVDIYSYYDYRDFIHDYYENRKLKNKRFSLQAFGLRVGHSKMSVKYVIDKKRHLSLDSLREYAKVMDLHGCQRDHFELLFRFSKAKNNEEKNILFSKVLKSKNKKFKSKFLDENSLDYFSKWYYPVIAELSYVEGFSLDIEVIRKALNFSVSYKEINEALVFLKENNFLKDSGNSDQMIKVPDELRSFIYKNYVLKTIELSKLAVEKLPPQKRESFNLTVSLSNERYEIAKKMIQSFRHELHQVLANDEECDRVIQVNLHMFEVANIEKLGMNDETI